MKIRHSAACSAILLTALPAGAETLDSLAEFGNAATANATSGAGIPRGADFTGAAAGDYAITAGGTDLWGTSDNGSFIYDADQTRAADEDFSVIVRSVSIAGNPDEAVAGEWGRTGIMARKTPDAANSAAVAHLRKTNNSYTALQGRPSEGAGTDRNGGEHPNGAANVANGSVRDTPLWLGLHRFGGQWYSTWAPDVAGAPGVWSAALQRPGTADTNGEVYVGLAHQSHNINPVVNTAVFEDFSVGAFDSTLGVFKTDYACDVTLSGAGNTLTASATELGGSPRDFDWEVLYLGSNLALRPGFLKADIYLAGNPASLAAVDTLITNNAPNGTTYIEQINWTTGSYNATNLGGTNLFAKAVPGSFGGNQDNYGVNLTGEIHIPSDADRGGRETVSFHDGVDDFTYLEIDGVSVIDNNQAGTVGGANGTLATLDVSDPKYDDGAWVTFRMTTWEGGGGDSASLVWDALDLTGADSVTGSIDANLNSYLGTGVADGPVVTFVHDASDNVPAKNFRTLLPEVLNSVSGTGQPTDMTIPDILTGTVAVEVYANGAFCGSTPTVITVESSSFPTSNVMTVVLTDAGLGGVADVDTGSLTATLDGDVVVPVATTVDGLTTVTYTFLTPPAPHTLYTLEVSGTTTVETGSVPFTVSATERSLPFLVELRADQPAPPNATEGWDYMEFDAVAVLGGPLGAGAQGFTDAQLVISTAAAPLAQALQPYVNHADPDSNVNSGDWYPDLPILSDDPGFDDDQYVTYARTTITIAAGDEGDYTFRVTGDDGYGLRVTGATFTSVAGSAVNVIDPRDPSAVYHPDFGGNSNAIAVANFPAAGDYLVEFFGFEGAFGAFQEVSWVKGSFNNLNQSVDWALLGDTSDFVSISPWGDLPASVLPPAPTSDAPGWSTYLYYGVAGNFGDLNTTMNFLRGVDTSTAVATILPELNHSDGGVDAGRFNPTAAYPGDPLPAADTDNIGMIARAFIVAPVAGEYTLQVRSDDGFLLRFANPATKFSSFDGAGQLRGTALNEIYFAGGTGDANSRGTVSLTAGTHEVYFVWWEGGGGSSFEVSSAPGNVPSQDGPYGLVTTTVSETNLYLGSESGGGSDFIITDFGYDVVADTFTLTFNSVAGVTYALMGGTDLVTFPTEIVANIPGDGSSVTVGPFANPTPGALKMFFRIESE